jgi:hypothetical protein
MYGTRKSFVSFSRFWYRALTRPKAVGPVKSKAFFWAEVEVLRGNEEAT